MNRPSLLLLAALALTACQRGAEQPAETAPTKEVAGGVALIDYDSPLGAFTCRAPAEWGIREEKRGGAENVSFVGPSDPRTGSAFIHILQYPSQADPKTDAAKYAESFWEIDPKMKQPDLERVRIGDRTVIRFHQERPFYKLHSKTIDHMERHDYAFIPVKGGFFEIWHAAPADSYEKTLPVFEAVVRGFKPKL